MGKECFYNKIYWKCNEYLGFGVFVSLFIDKKRIKNIDNIKEYIKRINNNESVEDEIYVNDIKDDIEEFMFMGFRMIEGISIDCFKERFNKNIYEVYNEVIEKNINEGLLIYDLGKLYLLFKGIEFFNYVMSDFILI